ncbi:S1 family peptidase [Prauserella oleivorans]
MLRGGRGRRGREPGTGHPRRYRVTAPYSFAGSLQRPDSPRSDGHVCGVTLIAPQWALTAGHCTRNPSGAQVGTPRDWTVRIGSVSTTSGGQVAAVDTFYAYSADPVREGDIALLHLETPVDAIPAALPVARPADHTPIRIVGWGMTCGQMQPRCFPDHLREADTEIQPAKLCERSGIAADRDLCIGSEDGSVAATNMDSGGPALVRTGESWTIVGTVSGSNGDDQPVVYTDVHHYADWIAGVLDGSAVPPESPVPDLEGAVALGGCSASVVRTASASPSDPALLLTNGHCVPQPPAPGKAVADLPMSVPVSIGDHQGYPRPPPTRLALSTRR